MITGVYCDSCQLRWPWEDSAFIAGCRSCREPVPVPAQHQADPWRPLEQEPGRCPKCEQTELDALGPGGPQLCPNCGQSELWVERDFSHPNFGAMVGRKLPQPAQALILRTGARGLGSVSGQLTLVQDAPADSLGCYCEITVVEEVPETLVPTSSGWSTSFRVSLSYESPWGRSGTWWRALNSTRLGVRNGSFGSGTSIKRF